MTTVVLGLDGAGFKLLEPWLDELPNLRRLTTDGVAADMESCLPPVTCPNWRCYSKGKNPGKLGVFWWEWVDRENDRIRNTSASDQFDGRDFWHELNGDVAVVNLPTSYPPESVDGVTIAGGPGSEQTGYTEPPSFESYLEAEFDYKVHPERLAALDKEDTDNECIPEIYELIDRRFDVLLDLVESGDYEFVHLTVFYVNMLQHFYYDDPVVKEAWIRIDERLGDLLDAENIDHLFLMSDHGSNRVEHWFRINNFLEERGYLVTESGISDFFYRLGITRDRIRTLLGRVKLEWWARNLFPKHVKNLLPDDEGSVDRSAKENHVDWERSSAIASGQGPIYVLESDPRERARVRDELVDLLDGLQDDAGNTIIRNAHAADDIYDGPHVDRGPDVVLDQAPNVHIDGGIGAEETFDDPQKWHGENKQTGLFVGYGPNVDDEADLSGMHITDIAPTILHLHGRPIPTDFDGTVRTELFEKGTEPSEREVATIDPVDVDRRSDGESGEQVQSRLENLGYLE